MSVKDAAEKELVEMIDRWPKRSFGNEHGEKFTIHSNGVFVYMSGNEVDQMVGPQHKLGGKYILLFNEEFSIWEVSELLKLGLALKEVAQDIIVARAEDRTQ